MDDKPLVWPRGAVKTPPFSPESRIEAGVLLRRLRRGETISLPYSRPMPSISKRCHELRINDKRKTWRIIYRVDSDAIVILDVFCGTTQQTPQRVIAACQRRLQGNDELLGAQMNNAKRKRLEASGWKVGSAADFLSLSSAEKAFVELKLSLSAKLKERRRSQKLSQGDLALRLGSSQSRVAKMEASDPTVSLDLLVRALLAAGATKREIAKAIASAA